VRRRTGVGVAWIRGGRKLELDKEENESEEEETTSRGCVLPLSCDGSRDRGPCKKNPLGGQTRNVSLHYYSISGIQYTCQLYLSQFIFWKWNILLGSRRQTRLSLEVQGFTKVGLKARR
jgi:hypothetical protein